MIHWIGKIEFALLLTCVTFPALIVDKFIPVSIHTSWQSDINDNDNDDEDDANDDAGDVAIAGDDVNDENADDDDDDDVSVIH